jgi:hypothetical protein
MSIKRALDNILEGNLDEMRQNFSSALTTKAVEKLEERKIEIAKNYFGQMQEEVEQIDEAPSKKRMKRELSAAARREEGARDGFGNEDEEKKSDRNYRRIEKKYGKKGIKIVNNRADHLLYGKRK